MSDISDWDWTAGGFPCRDMIRECIISNNCSQQKPTIPSLDPQTTQGNITSEILNNQPSTSDPFDCPISIIPGGQSATQPNKPFTSLQTQRLNPQMLQRSHGRVWRGQIGRLPNL